MIDSLTVLKLLYGSFAMRTIKKSLKRLLQGRTFTRRGTTLVRASPRGDGLWKCGIHFCAVTGGSRRDLWNPVGHATPRPCSAGPSAPLSTNRGSLCRICPLTLLFIVFTLDAVFKGGFSACPVVYTLSRPLSTVVLPETRVIQASFPGKPHKSAGNLRISAGSGKNQIASRGQNCYNAGDLDTTRDVLRRAITCYGICYAER